MESLEYRLYAYADQGKRDSQQDVANCSLPELQKDLGVICVLADGMGGLQDGRAAAEAAVETTVRTFHQSAVTDTPEQILLRCCCFAQDAVRRIQTTPGECGATFAAVLIRDDRCSFLSVGDSRIYLFRGGGLIQLTRDQNKAERIERQIALGRLPEVARTDAKRDALSTYIGIETLEQIDRSSHSFALGAGDRLLLVSDGVFRTLDEQEMTEILCLPGEMVTMTMIQRVMAKDRPRQDNCTAAIVECLPAMP